MDTTGQVALIEACRVLFGRDFDPSFLGHLQEGGLKAAWRVKALETHPDRSAHRRSGHHDAGDFIAARRAYALLQDHLGRRGVRSAPAAHRPSRTAAAGRPARPAPRPRGPHGAAALVPRRRLRLGEFLYHSRVIPFSTLIEALIWQRRQRDRFCEICRRWGHLSEAQVRLLLAERLPHEQVGATAQRLRLLTSFQVRTILAFQRSRQQPIGRYFVSHGHCSPAALAALIGRLERHNAHFSPG